ncbi:hypothetical protein BDM02DRAFT_827499 [Thelephora ganbajun]|uniref:Uncharacterized protein n=1 Tax=Thelephora ganbajun TaxID=370292 RepID=A0ACB6Z6Y1_THEGA|nr:hypothetical protein BDM02DRAFT_827499 [Thelephora ganbajun]
MIRRGANNLKLEVSVKLGCSLRESPSPYETLNRSERLSGVDATEIVLPQGSLGMYSFCHSGNRCEMHCDR